MATVALHNRCLTHWVVAVPWHNVAGASARARNRVASVGQQIVFAVVGGQS